MVFPPLLVLSVTVSTPHERRREGTLALLLEGLGMELELDGSSAVAIDFLISILEILGIVNDFGVDSDDDTCCEGSECTIDEVVTDDRVVLVGPTLDWR